MGFGWRSTSCLARDCSSSRTRVTAERDTQRDAAASPENGTRRTCSQVHRGSEKHDTGLRRTGRLAEVAGGAWGLRPRKAPLGARANRSWLLSCQLSLTRRLHPMSRFSDPLWTTPHTKKGTVPFFKGLSLSTSRTTPLRTSTSTQENGSRCAAQRVGGRLAV